MPQFAPADIATIDPLDLLFRLAVATAIGLLIGIERGWKEREGPEGSRTAGLRTFTLIGLLGGVSALVSGSLGPVPFAAVLLALAGSFAAFEVLRAKQTDTLDATTLVAAILVFMLSAAAGLGHLHAAGAAAVTTAAVLAFKETLHGWIRRITFVELRAGLILAAMTVIVLPLLPAQPVDPWNAISPRNVWLLTVLVAAISFTGYAAIKIVGPRNGTLAAGVTAGVVSSTAAVVSLARLGRSSGDPAAYAPGAMAANAVMFGRVGLVAGALRPELSPLLAASLLPGAAVYAVFAWWSWRQAHGGDADDDGQPEADISPPNPLELKTALTFGVLLAIVSLASKILGDLFGSAGSLALAAVAGLADVDAVTLTMSQSSGISVAVASAAILIAVASNTVAKVVLATLAGGREMGWRLGVPSAAAVVASAAGLAAWTYGAAI